MRRRTHALLLALVLALLAGCTANTAVESPVIAQVGNTYVTEEQFTNFMEFQIDSLKQDEQTYATIKASKTPEQIRQDLFDLMIQEEIGLNEARRNGAGIDSEIAEQIEASVDSQINRFDNKTIHTFGDYQNYVNEKQFASFAAVRSNATRNFSLDEYAQTVTVADPAAKPYPFLREIVVPVQQTATPEEDEAAHQRALTVAQQLRAGANLNDFVPEFTAMAPDIAQFQGMVGWIDPAGGGPEFEQAANSLPLNQFSDPIRTGLGWHVFAVTQRAQFPSWRAIAGSPSGVAFLQGKAEEYKQNGLLNYYFDISKIPLPTSFDEQK